MKKNLVLSLFAVLALLLGSGGRLCAQTLTWTTTSGTETNGAGTWTTSGANTNWWTGSANVSWINGDNAIIGVNTGNSGAEGTVTLGSNVTVGNLTFADPGGGGGSPTVAGDASSLYTLTITGTLAANDGYGAFISANTIFSNGLIATNGSPLTLSGTTSITTGGIVKSGGGTLTISGNYTLGGGGSITISGGTLLLTGASASSTSVPVTITGGGSLGAVEGVNIGSFGNISINGGTYQSSGTLTRGLGTATSQIQILGGNSGFDALGNSSLVVNLGGSGATLTWGSTYFNPSTLYLNTTNNAGTLNFVNGLDLAGTTRSITNGGNATNEAVTISGAIINSSGTAGVSFAGNGTTTVTILTGADTYNGPTTISNNLLQIGNGGASGSLPNTSGISGGGNSILAFDESGALSIATPISGGLALQQSGAGTTTLSGSNSFTGNTTISSGGLTLDFTSQNNNKLSTTGTLAMNGGTLTVLGNASATTSQTVAALTLGAASTNSIVVTSNGQSVTLALGGITQGAGATINFTLPALGAITTTAGNDAYGILGPYATVSGTAFATVSSGNIAAYVPPTQNNVATWTAGSNVGNTAGYAGTLATSTTIGILEFNAAAPSTVNLGSANALTMGDGAILMTAAVGNNAQIITSGTLTSTPTTLQVIQNDTANSLTINSVIGGAIGFASSGPGTVILGGNNVYTGATAVTAGTLVLTGSTGSTSTLTIASGATLQVGNGGATGSIGSPSSIVNNGSVVFNESGTVTLAKAMTGSGSLAVNSGTLNVDVASILPTADTVTVNTGGTLYFGLNDPFGNDLSTPAGPTIVVNGGQLFNNIGTAGLGFVTLPPVVLMGGTMESNVGFFAGSFVFTYAGGVTVSGSSMSTITSVDNTGGSNNFMSLNGAVPFIVNQVSTTGTDLLFTAQLQQRVAGSGIVKSGSGNMALTGVNNTYTGPTVINGGTLSVMLLANVNTNSSIGDGSSAGSAADLVMNGGTLRYIGATGTSNRLFSIGSSGGALDASGSGALFLTGTGAMGFNSQTGPRTFTVTGVNTGANTLAAQINDNSGSTSIAKTGAGSWILSGNNNYSGGTTVQAGTLSLSGSNSNGGAISVTGGTLNIQSANSLSASTLTVNGAALNLASGSRTVHQTFSLSSNGTALTLTTGTLTFGVDSTGADEIATAGSASLSGNTTINLLKLGSTLLNSGTYTLISAAGGGLNSGGTFSIASGLAGFNTTLLNSSTLEQLWISAITVAYWDGSVSGIWNAQPGGVSTATNWAANSTGTNLDNLPGILTDVVFSASGAGNETTTLGADTSIKSLTINDPTPVSIGGANTLTLVGTTGTTGLTVASGAGAVTVSANLALTGSSNIEVDSANGLTISGTVSGSNGIIKNGAGRLTLNASDTYSGGTVINSGTLQTGNAGALNSTTPQVLTINGGTLDLDGNNLSVTQLSGSSGGLVTSSASGNLTLTVTGNTGAVTTYSGVIQNGSATSVGLTKSGGDTLILAGNNTYTGATAISGGATLTITGALGNTAVTVGAATLNLDNASAIGQNVLTVNNAASVVTENTTNALGGTAALTQSNGLVTLSSANNFSGATALSSGTLQLMNAGSIGSSALTLSGGTLSLLNDTNNTTFTDASTTISGNTTINVDHASSATGNTLALGNVSTAGNTITVTNGDGYNLSLGTVTSSAGPTFTNLMTSGTLTLAGLTLTPASTQTATFNGTSATAATSVGAIAQNSANALAVTQSGSGTLILTGNNTYTGATSVNNGTLIVNGSLGATAVTVNSGGTLALGSSNAVTGVSSLTLNSNSTITSADGNARSFSWTGFGNGNVNIGKPGTGTLSFAMGNWGQNTVTLTINNASDIMTASGGTQTGSPTGDQLTKSGTGTLIIDFTNANFGFGSNTAGGSAGVVINAGSLQLGNNDTVGFIGIGGTGGTASITGSSGASLIFNRTDTVSNFSDPITGALSVTQNGSGATTLTGTNTYTGLTTINNGVLILGGTGALGTSTVTFGGGTLEYTSTNQQQDYSSRIVNSTGAIAINTNSQNVTFNNALAASNTGGLTKSGTGTLTLDGVNSYTGPTTITTGTLAIGGAGLLGGSSGLYAGNITDNGLFIYGSTASQTFSGSLAGSGTLSVTNGSLNVTGPWSSSISSGLFSGGSTTISTGTITSATVSSAANLTVSGATLTSLSANSNYTGVTTLNAGTIYPTAVIPATTAGTFDLNNSMTNLTVSGAGSTTVLGNGAAVTGTLTATAGTLDVANSSVATVANADLSSGGATVNTQTGSLAITNQLKLSGGVTLNYTAGGGATSFAATGSNLSNSGSASTLTLSGGTLTFNSQQAVAQTITVGASLSGSNFTAGQTSIGTQNFTVSGAGQVLVVEIGVRNGSASNGVTSVTYGGVAMSGSTVIVSSVASHVTDDIFYLYNPPTGSNALSVSFLSGEDYYAYNVFSLSGVSATIPVISGSNDNTTSGSPTNSVTLSGLTLGSVAAVFDAARVDTAGGSVVISSSPAASGTSSWSASGNDGSIEIAGGGALFGLSAGVVTVSSTFNGITATGEARNELEVAAFAPASNLVTTNFNLPNTSIAAIATSTLNFGTPGLSDSLGSLNLTGSASTVVLTLQNAQSISFGGIAVTGAAGTSAMVTGTGAPIAIASGGSISVSPSVALTIQSPIVDGTSTATVINKTGSGVLTLAGTDTYTGATTVTAGTLVFTAPNAYTGSTTVNSGATLQLGTGASGFDGTISSSSSMTDNGTLIFDRYGNYSSGVAITGGGAVTQMGPGTQTLSGSSNYTGATNVLAGKLIVSGSLSGTASVNLDPSTLEIDGSVNSACTISSTASTVQGTGRFGSLSLTGTSTLAPGLTSTGLVASGALTAAGNVTFSDTASALSIGIGITTGSDANSVAVGGTITLDKTPLQLTLGNALNSQANVGLAYIIVNGGAGGTGSGSDEFSYNGVALANDSTFTMSNGLTFEVIYGGTAVGTNDVGNSADDELVLTAIPEPGTWALMLSGVGMLIGWQRLRRRRN